MITARVEFGPPAKRPKPLMRVELGTGAPVSSGAGMWYLHQNISATVNGGSIIRLLYQSARVRIVLSIYYGRSFSGVKTIGKTNPTIIEVITTLLGESIHH